MTQRNSAEYVMQLAPGEVLDRLVDKALSKHVIVGGSCYQRPHAWSTNLEDAMLLMDSIEEHIAEVGILRMGTDAPNIISQLATIGEETDSVFVYTGSWMESLCKAFLLYEYGHRGDFSHPVFEQKMKAAPKRVIQ